MSSKEYHSNYYKQNREKVLLQRKEHYSKNKEQHNAQRIRRKYLISTGEFEALWKSQNCSCALCFKPLELIHRNTHIDHCHVTGKVRGVLCQRCNTALGALGDTKERLEKVVEYLSRNEK